VQGSDRDVVDVAIGDRAHMLICPQPSPLKPPPDIRNAKRETQKGAGGAP